MEQGTKQLDRVLQIIETQISDLKSLLRSTKGEKRKALLKLYNQVCSKQTELLSQIN
ncbi:MAG: hypothetical protein AAF599_03270 [Bacteroidota bacterium]